MNYSDQEWKAIFTQKVIEELCNLHQITDKEAERMLDDFKFPELIEFDSEFIMHYSPAYWAKEVEKKCVRVFAGF